MEAFQEFMAVAEPRFQVFFVHGMDGAFPSLYGKNRVIRVFRVQKRGFVKQLCYTHIQALQSMG